MSRKRYTKEFKVEAVMLRVPGMAHKIEALRQGVGVGYLPEHRVRQQLDAGELVALTLEREVAETPQYCSWRTANKGRARRWFVDRILAAKSS